MNYSNEFLNVQVSVGEKSEFFQVFILTLFVASSWEVAHQFKLAVIDLPHKAIHSSDLI